MRKQLIYFGVLCVVIFTACKPSNDTQQETQNCIESLNDLDIYKDLQANLTPNSDRFKHAGRIISRDSAQQKVNRAVTRANRTNENYGFVIGLDSLKKYIALIDSLNSKVGKDTIQAIRVYLVTSYAPAGNNGKRPYKDIMIAPVTSDGESYGLVDPGSHFEDPYDPGYLNTTMPCPKQCP